jgi:hypothetical protein
MTAKKKLTKMKMFICVEFGNKIGMASFLRQTVTALKVVLIEEPRYRIDAFGFRRRTIQILMVPQFARTKK